MQTIDNDEEPSQQDGPDRSQPYSAVASQSAAASHRDSDQNMVNGNAGPPRHLPQLPRLVEQEHDSNEEERATYEDQSHNYERTERRPRRPLTAYNIFFQQQGEHLNGFSNFLREAQLRARYPARQINEPTMSAFDQCLQQARHQQVFSSDETGVIERFLGLVRQQRDPLHHISLQQHQQHQQPQQEQGHQPSQSMAMPPPLQEQSHPQDPEQGNLSFQNLSRSSGTRNNEPRMMVPPFFQGTTGPGDASSNTPPMPRMPFVCIPRGNGEYLLKPVAPTTTASATQPNPVPSQGSRPERQGSSSIIARTTTTKTRCNLQTK